MRIGLRTTDSEVTPIERFPSKILDEVRGLHSKVHRLELVAYTAFAMAAGLLAGVIFVIFSTLWNR
jgi:hypothetical protein